MEQIAYGLLIIAIVMLLYLSISDYRKKFSSNAFNPSTAGTKIKWQEKREALRVEVKWPVTIETVEGHLNGETMDICISGAFICCQKPPQPKGMFRLTMNPPNHQALTATAEVVWSNSNVPESEIVNRGMGVRFLEISNEDRQFISEVAAGHHQ